MGLFKYDIEEFRKDALNNKDIKLKNLLSILDSVTEDDYILIIDAFFVYFYKNRITTPNCVNAFIVLNNMYCYSLNNGVWTYYEYEINVDKINDAIKYLDECGYKELALFMRKNIHDYHNPDYKNNYPQEWMDESKEFDKWILSNEKNIHKILFELLVSYKNSL